MGFEVFHFPLHHRALALRQLLQHFFQLVNDPFRLAFLQLRYERFDPGRRCVAASAVNLMGDRPQVLNRMKKV
jgi:hypothetical protein